MGKYCHENAKSFAKKVNENLLAAKLLHDENMNNAAATRLYYAFVLFALNKIASNEGKIPEDVFFRPDGKLNKGSIRHNVKTLSISNFKKFETYYKMSESLRVKADYFPESVSHAEMTFLIPRSEYLIESEGL